MGSNPTPGIAIEKLLPVSIDSFCYVHTKSFGFFKLLVIFISFFLSLFYFHFFFILLFFVKQV